MSVQSAPYYWVECDCCGERADYGDYAAWANESDAVDQLDTAYFQTVDGEELCPACWAWPEDMPGYDEATATSDDPVRKHVTHDE